MASVEDEIVDAVIACCSVNIACAGLAIKYSANVTKYLSDAEKKRRHRVWVSRYLAVRPQFGAYNSLMRDLLELDSTKFRNYIRLDPEIFEELFQKVEPLITSKDTRMRQTEYRFRSLDL